MPAEHADPLGTRGERWRRQSLRRKLIDHLRRGQREIAAADAGLGTADSDESGFINRLFESNGHWATPPAAWTNPDAALEQAEFYAAFEECCKDTSELVSRSLDEELSWRQRMAVRLHLLMCGACRRFVAQMGFIRQAARRYPVGRDQDSR